MLFILCILISIDFSINNIILDNLITIKLKGLHHLAYIAILNYIL